MTKWFALVAGVTLALAPGGAAAQASAKHSFTVDGKAFTMPVPQGYCLPSDETVALAEKVASLDSMNATHADIQRCGTFGEDYVHVKSPRTSIPVPLPRADFIALIARELQTAAGQQLASEAAKNGARDAANGTNNEIQIDPAAPRFAGKDEMCAYMAVDSEVMTPAGTIVVNGMVCMTVIGGTFMNVNAYGVEGKGVTEAQLKSRVRTIAASIVAAGA